ncbi:hypothetical protein GCM10027217_44460 [Pseudomaricurvus hydrocarbonicus]
MKTFCREVIDHGGSFGLTGLFGIYYAFLLGAIRLIEYLKILDPLIVDLYTIFVWE